MDLEEPGIWYKAQRGQEKSKANILWENGTKFLEFPKLYYRAKR